MTYSVAKDYLEYNIRCNSISPGRVHTPFVDGYLRDNFPGEEEKMFEKLSKTQPIGRMGIPDEILHKPGSLTEEEWVIMRQHPIMANDLLSKIEFLRPSIDIPYYHHEKWDGSGYPKGIKGEDIPIAARIFAIVDVWDALLWDRPYRAAWSKEKAFNYLKEQSGIHFDPRVADTFLEMIRELV